MVVNFQYWYAPCKGDVSQQVQILPGYFSPDEAIGVVMEVTKWLVPSVGYRSQAIPERPFKYELDVRQHLVNISYGSF